MPMSVPARLPGAGWLIVLVAVLMGGCALPWKAGTTLRWTAWI